VLPAALDLYPVVISDAMGADSVPLRAAAAAAAHPPRRAQPGFGWREGLLLFVLFLLVVSDYFVENILSLIPGSAQGREATNQGAVVQGVLLVLGYAALSAVINV